MFGIGGGFVNLILNQYSTDLIGFWIQDETSGATAEDSSAEGNDGAYTGVTLADATYLGRPVPRYDGVNDVLDVDSAGLDADFDGREGALIVPARVFNSGVWTDGNNRTLAQFRVDAQNRLYITSPADDKSILYRYEANGTSESYTHTTEDTDWARYGMTWSHSADEVAYYANGSRLFADTGLGAWAAGALVVATIGAFSAAPAGVWNGWIGPVPLWATALSRSVMERLTA
jgi:hypothetical protein